MGKIFLLFMVVVSFSSFADEQILVARCTTPPNVDSAITAELYQTDDEYGALIVKIGDVSVCTDDGAFIADKGFLFVGGAYRLTIYQDGTGELNLGDWHEKVNCIFAN